MARLQHEPIDAPALIDEVAGETAGATTLFTGTVRNHNRGRSVSALEYGAYEPMALAQMNKLEAEAKEKFEITAISLVHRLGPLKIGETAVAVAVAAAHRAASIDAARWIIDTLKVRVPIWKKERFDDGEVWIEGDADVPTG